MHMENADKVLIKPRGGIDQMILNDVLAAIECVQDEQEMQLCRKSCKRSKLNKMKYVECIGSKMHAGSKCNRYANEPS